MAVPAAFDEELLRWYRARTEAGWARLSADRATWEKLTDEQRIDRGLWHPDWSGARWLEPLSEDEIDAIERRWRMQFPSDFRLFLKWLHATDRPGRGGLFYDWRQQLDHAVHEQDPGTTVQSAFDHIVNGFAFDAIHNPRQWRSQWGSRPLTEAAARVRMKPIVDAAPTLIPLSGHRYLLGEPCRAGNPVLSIWQSDIIVWAPDLRIFLLIEGRLPMLSHIGSSLLRLTSRDNREVREEGERLTSERRQEYRAIPFWGSYL